jgi:MATE family multidrug resistance protein
MGWLGTIPLAAHGIAVQLSALTFMVHLGLSNAATVRAGNAYGRRDADHLARGARVVTVMSVLFALVTIIVFVGWPEPLINAFMQESEPARQEILIVGAQLLAVAALFQLVDGLQAIALGLLRGVLDTRIPMWIAAFSYWVVGIPCSYLLGFGLGWGGIGVWGGLVIGLGTASVLLNRRFWGPILDSLRQRFGGAGAVPAQ